MKKENVKRLVLTGVMLALATILSELTPARWLFGGTVTIASMLPVILIVLKYDFKWGLFAGFVYSILQLFLGLDNFKGQTALICVGIVFFDYIFPFMSVCLAGLFKRWGNVGAIIGTAVAMVTRFFFHTLSGIILWSDITNDGLLNSAISSFTYNAGYMIPEIIITTVAISVLVVTRAYKKIMEA